MRTAPVRLSDFLHSKLLIHLLPLAAMGGALSVVSCVVIGVPLAFTLISLGLVLCLALGVCTLGVGVGALHPKFTAENPAKIPTGIGGVVFMITSMGYTIVFLLATTYPAYVLYDMPRRLSNPIGKPFWFFTSLTVAVLLEIFVCWFPMWLGRRKLIARED